jgi:cytochrome P450
MTYFNDAKRRSEAGVAKDCMATYGLSQRGSQRMTDLEIAYTLSTPFSAGVETVRRFLISCLGAAN